MKNIIKAFLSVGLFVASSASAASFINCGGIQIYENRSGGWNDPVFVYYANQGFYHDGRVNVSWHNGRISGVFFDGDARLGYRAWYNVRGVEWCRPGVDSLIDIYSVLSNGQRRFVRTQSCSCPNG